MIALAEGKITREQTAQTLGLVDRKMLADLLEIIAAGNSKPVFEIVKSLFDSGADIPEFVNDFIDYLRNLLVQKSAADPDLFLDISQSEKETLKKQATFFTEADILRMIQILAELLAELKKGYDERIFLEICLVRLIRMESSISLQEVIERLNRLAGSVRATSSNALSAPASLFNNVKPTRSPAPSTTPAAHSGSSRPQTPPEPRRSSPAIPEYGEPPVEPGRPLNLPRVQTTWRKFLDTLKSQKPMLASMLTMGQVAAVKDNIITITFGPSGGTNKQVVEKPENKKIIETGLRDFYKIAVRINYRIDERQAAIPTDKPAAAGDSINADDLFKKDPGLKKFVEQINGDIVSRKKIED